MCPPSNWEKFRVKKKPTSDSNEPEEDITEDAETIYTKMCKVCRKAFSETETPLVCARCGHYVHAECSNTFEMATYDNLCIIEATGVDKRAFKVLYGFVHGYRSGRIRKAARFSKSEMENIVAGLVRTGYLQHKKLLVFDVYETTYKAHELSPLLEDIYGKERDVQIYMSELVTAGTGIGFSFPKFELNLGLIFFGILTTGFLVIMTAVASRVLYYIHLFRLGGDVDLVFTGFMIVVSSIVLYKLKKMFE